MRKKRGTFDLVKPTSSVLGEANVHPPFPGREGWGKQNRNLAQAGHPHPYLAKPMYIPHSPVRGGGLKLRHLAVNYLCLEDCAVVVDGDAF